MAHALSVGASESLRTTGGMADAPWLLFGLGALLGGSGGSFLSEPIASDLVSDHPEGLAAFSSRGPTDDGRTTPIARTAAWRLHDVREPAVSSLLSG